MWGSPVSPSWIGGGFFVRLGRASGNGGYPGHNPTPDPGKGLNGGPRPLGLDVSGIGRGWGGIPPTLTPQGGGAAPCRGYGAGAGGLGLLLARFFFVPTIPCKLASLSRVYWRQRIRFAPRWNKRLQRRGHYALDLFCSLVVRCNPSLKSSQHFLHRFSSL